MNSFVWFAISSYYKKQIALMIFYIAIAILFNPFKPFWFQKNTWHLIDLIIAAITTLMIIFDWCLNKKNIINKEITFKTSCQNKLLFLLNISNVSLQTKRYLKNIYLFSAFKSINLRFFLFKFA